MFEKLDWIDSIAPDFTNVISRRFRILQQIRWMQPVGRRILANELKISERVLRTDTDLLKKTGLVKSSQTGMTLTTRGEDIVDKISDVSLNSLTASDDERQLASMFKIRRAVIVPGDLDEQDRVMVSLGRVLNESFNAIVPSGDITVAVTGGTTMSRVSSELTMELSKERSLMFVPARGSMGESIEIQANSVCESMAYHTDGTYRTLYVPENLSEKSLDSLIDEPSISEVLKLVEKSDVLVHSIGIAETMAERRNLSNDTVKRLKDEGATSEVFGNFYDGSGNLIYKVPRIGLDNEDLNNINYVFAVAGGSKKADAISSYMKNAPSQSILITDEGASDKILRANPLK